MRDEQEQISAAVTSVGCDRRRSARGTDDPALVVKTYDQPEGQLGPPRSHPWRGTAGDRRSRYFDLKERPSRVRTSMEDLLPWADWPAIETFYRLLEWLNGVDSVLESNDCAFTGPEKNTTSQFAKALETSGRLMILWRHLPHNLAREHAEWLKRRLHQALQDADRRFDWGAVGMTLFRARFVTLDVPADEQLGFQVIVSFWSWGDTEEEAMGNLDRTVHNIDDALHAVEREARAAAWYRSVTA